MFGFSSLEKAFVFTLACTILLGCNSLENAKEYDPSKKVKRVFYLNSYGSNYSLGQVFTKVIEDSARTNRLKLTVYFLNAKSSDTPREKGRKIQEVIQEIEHFDPEVIIISEDPGIERIIPYLSKLKVPIVFTGADWSVDSYGLPPNGITGIIDFPDLSIIDKNTGVENDSIKHVFVLGGNSEINKRSTPYLQHWADSTKRSIEFNWAKTQQEWEIFFQDGQQASSLLVLLSEEGVEKWDELEAEFIVNEYISVPVVSLSSTMANCALFTYYASEEEQAEWAMNKALSIYQSELGKLQKVKVFKKLYKSKFLEALGITADSIWLNESTAIQ